MPLKMPEPPRDILLGVNLDHVATLRQARGGAEPDPVQACVLAEMGGADQITVHLREDRRHIQDRDLRLLRQTASTRLNLELALAPEIIAIALEVKPDGVTLVPERRQELTTEGGLDAAGQRAAVRRAAEEFRRAGIAVSLFLDPDPVQVQAAREAGADAVELHTGAYSRARSSAEIARELSALGAAAVLAGNLRLGLRAGHGLNYRNLRRIKSLPGLEEVNIGHSIVSRAVFVGLERAVREMKDILLE